MFIFWIFKFHSVFNCLYFLLVITFLLIFFEGTLYPDFLCKHLLFGLLIFDSLSFDYWLLPIQNLISLFLYCSSFFHYFGCIIFTLSEHITFMYLSFTFFYMLASILVLQISRKNAYYDSFSWRFPQFFLFGSFSRRFFKENLRDKYNLGSCMFKLIFL